MSKFIDLTGQRFGRLTVIERAKSGSSGRARWLCKCDCGNQIVTDALDLRRGTTRSCGCICKEIMLSALKKNIETNARGFVCGTCAALLNGTIRKDNTTGIRGVRIERGKFRAEICFKGKRYNVGIYATLEEAAAARKEAEQRIWGDFLEWYNGEYKKEVAHG